MGQELLVLVVEEGLKARSSTTVTKARRDCWLKPTSLKTEKSESCAAFKKEIKAFE
jgi:hypothetical protein